MQDNQHDDLYVDDDFSEDEVVDCKPLTNMKHPNMSNIYHQGKLTISAKERNLNYKRNKCHLPMARSILIEYSKDKYLTLADAFRKNKDQPWPTFDIFIAWLTSVDELREEFEVIENAKKLMIESHIIAELEDDSADYLKDERGNKIFSEKGVPIENHPQMKRKMKKVDFLIGKNAVTNPQWGKQAQAKEEAKVKVTTAQMLADALADQMRNEKEIQGEVIDSDEKDG